MLKPASMFGLGVLFASAACANPIVEKLHKTAALSESETAQVLVLYRQLYQELLEVRVRPQGFTDAQHGNLIRAAYKRHREASLEYLRPNQYRKWMTVAARGLPRAVKIPYGSPISAGTGFTGGVPFRASASSGLRYE
ncbi:MAG: hypothetical protein AAF529_00460 [Pseudomonadota bacterium]